MRLPEAKIKEAIVHPEKFVRREAVQYFSSCYSPDQEVMPRVIQAIERYGRSRAFAYFHNFAQLAQTADTIDWAIRELHQEEGGDEYFSALTDLLCRADPLPLQPRADDIVQAPGFRRDSVPDLKEWLELATGDGDLCWKELERISEQAARKDAASEDVDYHHADRVVQTLARKGEKHVDRILDLLRQEVEDYETDPMAWLEIFLVQLAGEMRLTAAVPLVVQKLHQFGEILSEECVETLGKIGTDAAAQAVTDGWLEFDYDYRLYASSILERIHSDATVRICGELLPQEKDRDIRTWLAFALLNQIADESIEPVYEMIQQKAYDPSIVELKDQLVAVSTILGVTFPEQLLWQRAAEEKWARQERRWKEMKNWFRAPPPVPEPTPDAFEDRHEFLERKSAPFLHTEKHVGRNDPCPCGSGKKFKKCCLLQSKR